MAVLDVALHLLLNGRETGGMVVGALAAVQREATDSRKLLHVLLPARIPDGVPGVVGVLLRGMHDVVVGARLVADALVDQMAWVLSAGFTRASAGLSETPVTAIRSFEFVGTAIGSGFVAPLAWEWGIAPTLFAATSLLLVAFVARIPTYEPRLSLHSTTIRTRNDSSSFLVLRGCLRQAPCV